MGNNKTKTEPDGDIYVTRKQIYAGFDKYAFETKDVDHLLASSLRDDDKYSYQDLERKFSNLKPPFKFVGEEEHTPNNKQDEDVEYLDNENFDEDNKYEFTE